MASVYGKAGSDEAKKLKEDAALSFAIVKNWDVAEGGGSLMIMPD